MRAGRGRPSHARMQRAAAARLDMLPAAAADPAAPRQRFGGKYLRGEKKHERMLVICAKVFARVPGTRIAPPGQARARCITWLPAEPCSGAIRQRMPDVEEQDAARGKLRDLRASHQDVGKPGCVIFFAGRAWLGHRVREGRERSAHTKSRAIPRNLSTQFEVITTYPKSPSIFFQNEVRSGELTKIPY